MVPDVDFITFNNEADIQKITTKTAGIILESIQGGAGFIQPENDFLQKVRQRCDEVGALLIIDEIQPGFGRTGKLFGFENYNVVPDVVILGKGMGGGMPVGAFTASAAHMDLLSDNPKLGHITTFGGHPVIAAACLATLQEITETELDSSNIRKGKTVPITFGTSFANRNPRKRIDVGSNDNRSRNHQPSDFQMPRQRFNPFLVAL